MNYWLAKSEPDVFSIDDLKNKKKALWDGVRNYQARNFLMEMNVDDLLLFYHSNANPIGIAGIGKVSKKAVPDPSQFDSKSEYYDPKATKEKPRWFCPEISFVEKFKEIITLDQIKAEKTLQSMKLVQKGNRLSVMPVTEKEFKIISNLK